MSSSSYSIGIDLGTANTRTAIFRNGDTEMVPHEGEFAMPSCVAFTGTSRLVGSAAKSQASLNPCNTIFGALRFIGRNYSDSKIQQIIPKLPFRVVEQAGTPVFLVTFLGEEQTITPTEILAMILSKARRDAQEYLGPDSHITSAVIAVPVSFTFQQRQAIWDAAVIARLRPERISSTATMICADYAFTQRFVEPGNILVIDCGAGFLDVAIATVEEGVIQVKAVGGDNFLGGDDFDSCLMKLLLDKFNTSWLKVSAREKTRRSAVAKARLLRRLRTACEKAKCELSTQTQTHIEIENLFPKHYLCETITQNDMVLSCNELFTHIAEPVALTMEDAHIDRWAIDTVLITGGSSRTPLVHSTLCESLSKPQTSRSLNADEAGARGAAFTSAVISGDESLATDRELLLLDVAPASIGIEVTAGTMCKIIRRNTGLPSSSQVTLTTYENQQEYSIIVYEGEDARV
jgi:heat shock protein 1/8